MADQVEQFTDAHYEERRESKRGCGCIGWGCLIVTVICFGLIIVAVVSLYYGYSGLINEYTSEEPMAIEVVELPEEELAELTARFEAFEESVEAGEATGQIELTAREINALIGQNDDVAGKVFVRIEDGEIGGDVSLPLDFLPLAGGRFFNASAEFDVSMEGGVLIVTLQDATVNGAELPEEFVASLQSENLAKEVYDDPDAARALRQFESLEIVGDKVILKAKPKAESAEEPAADAQEDTAPAADTGEAETEADPTAQAAPTPVRLAA